MNTESDMEFFLLVAQKRSLSAAALVLSVTPSAVSRRLTRIENRLGVRLMNRTTRRTSLTSEGEVYIKASRDIIGQIVRLENSIAMSRDEPRGLLQINASFKFGREHIAPRISAFNQKFPEVEIQLHLSDQPINLVKEGFDLGIRFGLPQTSGLITRLLMRNKRFLIASPSYLKKRGEPIHLTDLEGHDCIILRQQTETYDVWRFDNDKSARISGPLSTNDGDVALSWVLDGQGIMLRSEWDAAKHVKSGELNIILNENSQKSDIYAVYPERHNLSAKVSTFINFIREDLNKHQNELRLSE